MANYILLPTVKLSKLSKTQSHLMTAEHPNIDKTLLSPPVNYFCVTTSKAILYAERELLQSDYHHLFHRVQSGGMSVLCPSVRLVLFPRQGLNSTHLCCNSWLCFCCWRLVVIATTPQTVVPSSQKREQRMGLSPEAVRRHALINLLNIFTVKNKVSNTAAAADKVEMHCGMPSCPHRSHPMCIW